MTQLFNLAQYLLRVGKVKSAYLASARVIKAKRNWPDALALHANILVELGEHQPAVHYIQKAASLLPGNIHVVARAAHVLFTLDRVDHAEQLLKNFITEHGTNEIASSMLQLVREGNGGGRSGAAPYGVL